MTWGNRLLDPENFAAQEREARQAANPWGPAMGLPEEVIESDLIAVEPSPEVPPTPKVETLSAATIEQRLAEDPASWPDMLALEIEREAPRKSVLRAVIRTAKENGGDADAIAKAEEFLAAL